VKIYVAAVQAPRKKETQDETQFPTKLGGKTSLGPCYFQCSAVLPFRENLQSGSDILKFL
jgi:hypothetical protein